MQCQMQRQCNPVEKNYQNDAIFLCFFSSDVLFWLNEIHLSMNFSLDKVVMNKNHAQCQLNSVPSHQFYNTGIGTLEEYINHKCGLIYTSWF